MKGQNDLTNSKQQPTICGTRGISLDIKKPVVKKKYESPQNNLNKVLELSHLLPKAKEKYHSFSPNRINGDNALLPPLKPSESNTIKTLVLDLDETLIHSSFTKFSIEADITLQVDLDNQIKEIYILTRPNLDNFLDRVSKCYEIVIFTAGQSNYANKAIEIIDKQKVCKYCLFREQCTLINNNYVKELKRLNRNLKNVIILDNNPNAYSLNIDNGIPIKSFIDDKSDNELIQMAYVLEKLSKANDVRLLIKELVNMNQIDYDKTFELFKQKENLCDFNYNNNNDDANNNLRLLSESSIKVDKSNNNSHSIGKKQVKIVSVEKVDSKPCNSQNNSSSTIKDSKLITMNNSKALTKTSFYSGDKSNNLSQSPNYLGKSFCSNSKDRNMLANKGKCLAFSNMNKGSKDKKVIVLPNPIIHKTKKTDAEIANIKIKKKNTALNQSIEKTLKNNNFTGYQLINEKDLRPASVIPLKTNPNKQSNIIGLHSKQEIIKQNKRKDNKSNEDGKQVVKSTNIPNIQLSVENNKPLLTKGNQSSRSINNLPTTTSYPRTQRKSKINDTQSFSNTKLFGQSQSIQKKASQVTLKISNNNNSKPSTNHKGHQSKSDLKIIKVISNKEISNIIRSKTSMEKSNHFKTNNARQSQVKSQSKIN